MGTLVESWNGGAADPCGDAALWYVSYSRGDVMNLVDGSGAVAASYA